jgi:predicted nicotinamide N-methyase
MTVPDRFAPESPTQPVGADAPDARLDFPLHSCRVHVGGRAWEILYTEAVVTQAEEQEYLGERRDRHPYGIVLWPSAIALAHEIASNTEAFRGRRVLELGAGTGLPGIVAASLGAEVTQMDRQELAMAICRTNGARNGVRDIRYELADWSTWTDERRYDWIIGADVLYADGGHAALRERLLRNLAPGGRILLADPFRVASLRFLEALEADGWGVSFTKWSIGERDARAIGLFSLVPPA